MTTWRRAILTTILAIVTGAWTLSAFAVIKVEIPVSKIYDDAKTVVIGTVARVNPDNSVVDIKPDQTLKGDPPGELLRVQVAVPDGLARQVAPGQRALLFIGERDGKPLAVVHLADTWLLADGLAGANPTAWRVVQTFDAARSFPGRTEALCRVVAELKAGKPTLLDVMNPEAFRGPVRQLANLKVRPTFLAAADVNGDGNLDLIVGTAHGVRLFLSTGKDYADATAEWGLGDADAAHCSVADINGDAKPDLLLGSALWLNDKTRFVRAKTALDLPQEADWLAAALSDVTGDGRPDIAVLLKTGRLLTRQNPGAPDKPWPHAEKNLWDSAEPPLAAAFSNDWGDNAELHALVVRARGITRYPAGPSAGTPADFARLTGLAFASDGTPADKRTTLLFAAPVDSNGDRRTDFLVVTEGGGWALINRGFGSFFHSTAIHPVFHATGDKALPFKLTPGAAVAAGRNHAPDCPRQHLLVLTEDGHLFEMENPPE